MFELFLFSFEISPSLELATTKVFEAFESKIPKALDLAAECFLLVVAVVSPYPIFTRALAKAFGFLVVSIESSSA